MSAVQKKSGSSSSSKSTSGSGGGGGGGGAGQGAKGKVSAQGAGNFAGSLAVKAGTPPQPPPKLKPAKKPKKKKTTVGDAAVMGAPPNTNNGPSAAPTSDTAIGGGAGAGVGKASETSKAAKDITSKKPSKFLTAHKAMGKKVTAAKKKDEKKAHAGIPEFHATMPSDAQAEAENKEKKTNADDKVDHKGEGPEAKAKVGPQAKAKKSPRQKTDSKTKSELKKYEEMLQALQNIFGSVVSGINTDSQVTTDPGPAPEIEFSGQSNPQRADKAHKNADSKINAGHEKFAKAIDEGKQPSDVKRKELDEVHTLIKNPDPTFGEEQVADGQKYYEKLMAQHTSQEIDGADNLFHNRVQSQMAEANDQMDSTLEKQETDRKEAVANLEKDIDAKNQEAKDEQEKIVSTEKAKIADAQKETRKKQDKEVKKAKRKGDKERRKVEKEIGDREKSDEKKIKGKYQDAEKKSEGEKKKAHKKAEAKKKEAKKKQKKKSWWDRVKSAVSDFVDSVCNLIGDIFDALGKLVSGILNAVKKLANAIIDEAIKWAKKALDGLGSMMKGLVDGLIGDIFPGAAKWLNDKIDQGIDVAKKGVDKVGEDLKKGVNSAVDGVNKTIQTGLQVAKKGAQTAVRVAGKVAVGDFEGAFLETLYGALDMAGVSRGDADKMLGQASDTLKSIVDNPGAVIGNLIKAGKDGFVNFGKNFLGHFGTAVKTWLLGPVAAAGLKAPKKWDAEGIFGMALDVMGVNKESLMGMAEERIGKNNMGALQKAFDYVKSFMDGGFAGLWKQIKGDLGNLWSTVLGMVTEYISGKVVTMAAEKLGSLLAGPLGALYQALKTAWNVYCTIRDKIDQIKKVLTNVFNSINDIVKGNTSKASKGVEQALVNALGVAIDLLARVLGISDIPQQIKGFIESLQARVKKAIGKAMDWVLDKVKGLFKSGKNDKKQDAKPVPDESGQSNGRSVSQLPKAKLASSMGAIDISFRNPSGNGHPPILNSKGGVSGPLRGKSIPALEKQVQAADKSAEKTKALESLKHAKGVAMGLENKGQRYLAGDKNKSEIKKAMDLLGAHVLTAADFVGKLNKGEKGLDKLPKAHHFKGGGEDHKMWFQRKGDKPELWVASENPETAEKKIARLAKVNDGDKEVAKTAPQAKKDTAKAEREALQIVRDFAEEKAIIDDYKNLEKEFKLLFDETVENAKAPIVKTQDDAKNVVKTLKNWNKVKKAYANDERKDEMWKIIDYRKFVVDGILDNPTPGPDGKLKYSYKALGSVNLTSDYDLSLDGRDDVAGVEAFNKTFRSMFGAEAGTVFDTNVYTKGSFMPDPTKESYADYAKRMKAAGKKNLISLTRFYKQDKSDLPEHKRLVKRIDDPYKAKTKPGADAVAKAQDVAALVKMRTHMSKTEFKSHGIQVSNKMETKAQQEAVLSAYGKAEKTYMDAQTELYKLIKGDDTEASGIDKAHGKRRVKIEKEVEKITKQNPNAVLKATNNLYAEKLKAVAATQKERTALSKKLKTRETKGLHVSNDEWLALDKLTARLKDETSKALLFANEAYFSEGALRHVVGNMQAKYGYKLDAQQLQQSFNENYGDALKDISHYASKDFGYCAYRSSKYIDRMVNATKELKTRFKLKAPPQTTKVGLGATYLLRIRGDKGSWGDKSPDKKNEGGREFAKKHWGVTSASALKKLVTDFSVEVSAAARNLEAGPGPSAKVK